MRALVVALAIFTAGFAAYLLCPLAVAAALCVAATTATVQFAEDWPAQSGSDTVVLAIIISPLAHVVLAFTLLSVRDIAVVWFVLGGVAAFGSMSMLRLKERAPEFGTVFVGRKTVWHILWARFKPSVREVELGRLGTPGD